MCSLVQESKGVKSTVNIDKPTSKLSGLVTLKEKIKVCIFIIGHNITAVKAGYRGVYVGGSLKGNTVHQNALIFEYLHKEDDDDDDDDCLH